MTPNFILLREELTPTECNLVEQTSQDAKDLWLSGIFMQAGIRNRNGRVYPVNEIAMAVEGAKQRIRESKGIMGELDHPQTLTINLDRVSHVITELDMSGQNAIGKAKLMGTPMGNIAKELVRNNVALGVSSRGAGQVTESGGVNGFQFVTVDIVAQPSAPQAYPNSVYESLDMYRNGKKIIDLAEAVRTDTTAQKYFLSEMTKWINTGLFAKK